MSLIKQIEERIKDNNDLLIMFEEITIEFDRIVICEADHAPLEFQPPEGKFSISNVKPTGDATKRMSRNREANVQNRPRVGDAVRMKAGNDVITGIIIKTDAGTDQASVYDARTKKIVGTINLGSVAGGREHSSLTYGNVLGKLGKQVPFNFADQKIKLFVYNGQ